MITSATRIVLACSLTFSVVSAATAQPFAYVSGVRVPLAGGSSVGAQTLVVVDTATNTRVTGIPLEVTAAATAEAIAIAPGGARIYVANQISGTVSVIDAATNGVLGSIFVGAATASDRMALAVSPDGARLYVLNRPQVLIVALDTASVVGAIPLGPTTAGNGLVLSPDGARLYVSDFVFSLKVVDIASRAVIASIPLPDRPAGMDITPDGATIYIAGGASNAVFVVSTAANALVGSIGIGSYAGGLRVAPNGARVYVVTLDALRVIDRASNAVIGTVTGITNPRQLDFTPDGARAFVTALGGVAIVNTATNTATGTVPISIVAEGTPFAIRIPSPPVAPPGPPSNLVASSIVGNTLTLQWHAPAAGTPPSGYRVEGGISPGQVLGALATGSASTSFTFVAPSGAFYVRVHGLVGAVKGPASNEIQIAVPGGCSVPLTPVNIVASKSGSTITVSWDPAPGGPPATGYVLIVSGAFVGSFATASRTLSGTVGPGVYQLSVAATNGCGTSAPTATQSVTVP